MKKLNSKGFAGVEVLILVIVVLALGATAYYVLKKNEHKDTTNPQPVSQTTSQPQANTPSLLKEYKNTEHGFSFQYPSNWKLTEKLEASNRGEGTNRTEGDVTVTSPSGTIVHFGPNFGGKGGECIDDEAGGKETTRTCATLTVYSAEKIVTNSGIDPIYYYQASVTQPLRSGGQTSYMIFISNNTYYPTKPGSVLGVIFMPFDEIHTNKSEITVYVEGKDTSQKNTKVYFDSPEAKEATPILKSFRII